jgi:hypothetical protein
MNPGTSLFRLVLGWALLFGPGCNQQTTPSGPSTPSFPPTTAVLSCSAEHTGSRYVYFNLTLTGRPEVGYPTMVDFGDGVSERSITYRGSGRGSFSHRYEQNAPSLRPEKPMRLQPTPS